MPVSVLKPCLTAGITAKAVIADIEPETFELVLSWMYGTIDYCPWLCKAAKLYVASDRLGMTVLKDACAQAIALALPMTIHSEHIEDIEELWEFATEIQSAVVRDVSITLCHMCASMSVSQQSYDEAVQCLQHERAVP